MGFLDKLTQKVQDTIENQVIDNASRKAEEATDKAMDANTYRKKEEEPEEVPESSDELTDKKKCPSCGFVTKVKFCGNCGADLSNVEFMTKKELDEL